MMAMASSATPNATTIKPHNHPPYKEMIVSAIESLKERKGLSKKAIAKYIVSNYNDLPPAHNALLSHHLGRLKKKGVLRMVGKSYKLANYGKALHNAEKKGSLASGEKRKPGRPRKLAAPLGSGEKRKPGRPKKLAAGLALGEKRKAGRPEKLVAGLASGEKRKPGRPKKLAAVLASGEKRKPGRPKKLVAGLVSGEKKKPGRPKKLAAAPASGEKRKPGRPKKPAAALESGESRKPSRSKKLAAALTLVEKRKPGHLKRGSSILKLVAASASGEERKRGRPPKNSSFPFKPKFATMLALGEKRKAGRPRKGSSSPKLAVALASGEKRKRGRPKKVSPAVGEVSAAAEGGGGILTQKTMSSPEKTVGKEAVEGLPMSVIPLAVSTSGEKRKRGRPKKVLALPNLGAVDNGGDGLTNAVPSTTSKRRGRPPKKFDPSVPEN